MKQAITGFHLDDESHWVAELKCGHVQHVRNNPPLERREWTQTAKGRNSMLGHELNCVKCDDGQSPDQIKLRNALNTISTNTILYCRRWQDTLCFYRDTLGLKVNVDQDWLVEFQLTNDSFISIADASRTSIAPVDGQGITLAWKVSGLTELAQQLNECGIETSEIQQKWNALTCMFYDPEGHRIEIWQPLADIDASECDLNSSVPDWVIEYPSLVRLFEQLGIDYCCGGKSLATACNEQGLHIETVLQKISEHLNKAP